LPVLVNARRKPRVRLPGHGSKDAPGALWRVSMPVLAQGLTLGSTSLGVGAPYNSKFGDLI
jgi:hypothetical protein